ncbi:hypothetical protein DUI87_11222 [Hirundo rustica rustica]|uniref:Uncharacterized protein n=1 Tax=Hirundo rustica rustica TaxID=333673 RepID=A0A3M0KY98_HIRRU|nr:hypothetical protein DUI87_11222 [Hirundo rustica rustica]
MIQAPGDGCPRHAAPGQGMAVFITLTRRSREAGTDLYALLTSDETQGNVRKGWALEQALQCNGQEPNLKEFKKHLDSTLRHALERSSFGKILRKRLVDSIQEMKHATNKHLTRLNYQ